MLFEIKKCKVVEVRDVTSGTSRSGNAWTKATAVVEVADGNYTNTFPMLVFGDKIQEVEALVGKEVDIKFSIQGREYNDRYYTDLRLHFIAQSAAPQPQAPAPAPKPEPQPQEDGPDLPF